MKKQMKTVPVTNLHRWQRKTITAHIKGKLISYIVQGGDEWFECHTENVNQLTDEPAKRSCRLVR